MTRTIATAILLSLTLSVLLTYAAADAPAEVVPARISQAPARSAVLPVLYTSYVALQTGVQRQFDQAAKYLVQQYSDIEGPRLRRE